MSLKKKILTNPYLWMLIISVISYWPIAFHVFSLKNDNIMVFLAFRYNISEAIQQAHLPLWTPYMNAGFPMHADMQSGAWNPTVWFFSLFSRYTLSTLHLETLLYIFLAGSGMYHLIKKFVKESKVAFAFALAYLMCGYMSDIAGNNILFLAGAAFTPWVLSNGYALYKQPELKYAVALSISFYFLFSSAYPFFTLVSGYILLLAFLYLVIYKILSKELSSLKTMLVCWGIAALTFLIIAAPALYSYLQFLPEYSRGNQISLTRSNENNLEYRTFISFLLPNASLKNNFIATDLTMRNAFIGLIPLVLIIAWTFIRKKTRTEWFLFYGILIGFLYAAGSLFPLHKLIFSNVPLMDHFRHPANARLFFTIAATLLAASTFVKIKNNKSSSLIFKIICSVMATGIVIYLCCQNETFYDNALSSLKNFSFSGRDDLKQSLANFNTPFYIVSNAVIQICFLITLSATNYQKLKQFLIGVVFVNSFIFLQISMPVTQVSKLSPASSNKLLRSFPQGYPPPSLLVNIAQQSYTDSAVFLHIGHEMFYNKKMGFPSVNYNPTILNNMDSLMNTPSVFNKIMQQPFAFLAENDSASRLSVVNMNNNEIIFNTQSNSATSLHLQQTFTKNRKAYIDDKETMIRSFDIAFMSVDVPSGVHKISFIYQPPYILFLLIISMISFFFSIMYLLIKNYKGDN